MTVSDEDIYSLNGKTSHGALTPHSASCEIYTPCWHFIHYTNGYLDWNNIFCIFYNFLTDVYLPHHRTPCLDLFLFKIRKYYIIINIFPTPFPLCFFVSLSFT